MNMKIRNVQKYQLNVQDANKFFKESNFCLTMNNALLWNLFVNTVKNLLKDRINNSIDYNNVSKQ